MAQEVKTMRPKASADGPESRHLVVRSQHKEDLDSLVRVVQSEPSMKKKSKDEKIKKLKTELRHLLAMTGGRPKLIEDLPRKVHKQSESGNVCVALTLYFASG